MCILAAIRVRFGPVATLYGSGRNTGGEDTGGDKGDGDAIGARCHLPGHGTAVLSH